MLSNQGGTAGYSACPFGTKGQAFCFVENQKGDEETMVKVTLKGDVREYEAGTTIAEIAKSIGAGLYKAACAGKIDGEAVDLRTPVTKDCTVEIMTFDSPEGKHAYWHTTSHIMAQAVQHLFPDAVFAIGPAIDNGFYYDMDLPRTLTPEDLEKIPQKLVEYTLKHFNETKIENVFGKTEQALYEELIHDHSTASYVSETPVFYIDKDFSVYPNITAPAPAWFLGNLKTEGIETILKNYTESKSVAQAMRLTVPLCDIVASQGDCQSQRLFDKGDYIDYLTNKYCRK